MDGAHKRKQPSGGAQAGAANAKKPRFPQKVQHNISAHPTRSAYPDGEINVKNFLKSHENEIKSLENAMIAAKKGLARRAFQDVPRDLRRRTASHNPRRVPKRLRVRAKQEATDDNTPISRGTSGSGVGKGKKKHLRKKGIEESRQKWQERATKRKSNRQSATSEDDPTPSKTKKRKTAKKFPTLAVPATPPSRFRRRQRNKTWLPTHLWHTKRARMTDPKNPLWKFALTLQPVTKAYRLTHRAASQHGAVAWDMSYMSTIGLQGPEASIIGLLKTLSFGIDGSEDPWRASGRAKKWRHGTRAWEGWICERDIKPVKKIAVVTAIWCVPDDASTNRQLFIRVHPSALSQLFGQVERAAKIQKPAVTVRDLRFDIGSIELRGPAAAETLCSILSPSPSSTTNARSPAETWPLLASVTNAASLPNGALLAFDISDPRLQDPPKTYPIAHDQAAVDSLTETLANWPVDETQTSSTIFDINARSAAARCMPSQKSINRRKSECTKGDTPEARSTDPRIPMLLYASREHSSWTVLLPWRYVMPVWRGIMRYPVSTGGNPRFGGLKERRQVDFERSKPCFPFDYPGTIAGLGWEYRQRESRKHEWTKRPKGKRIEWSTIDLGNGNKGEVGDPWACDWEKIMIANPKPDIVGLSTLR